MQRISDTSSIRITWPGIRYSIVGCHSSKFPSVIKVKQKTNYLFKGILSTKIVICSYPKLLFSVLTFIKWRLTPSYIYPAFVPFGRYFTSIHLSLWICQSPLYSTSWHFLFCPRTTCCLLFLNRAHTQDVFT
jgi:hypothetical protein